MIMGKGIKSLSTIGGIIGSSLIIFSYIYPNKISRKAGSVTMGASKMLSRINTLVNVGYGEELGGKHGQSPIHEVVTPIMIHEVALRIHEIQSAKQVP